MAMRLYPHRKTAQTHARSNYPGMTVCGMDTFNGHNTKMTDDWKKVTCGNCRAVRVTGSPYALGTPPIRGDFYLDNGEGGTVTAWEVVDGRAYALNDSGDRMGGTGPLGIPVADLVETYGPIMMITEVELLRRAYGALEKRVADLE